MGVLDTNLLQNTKKDFNELGGARLKDFNGTFPTNLLDIKRKVTEFISHRLILTGVLKIAAPSLR